MASIMTATVDKASWYPYLKEREKQQAQEYELKFNDLAEQIRTIYDDAHKEGRTVDRDSEDYKRVQALADQQEAIDRQMTLLAVAAERRYIEKNLPTADAILDSARQILANETKQSYLAWQARTAEALKFITDRQPDPDATDEEKERWQQAVDDAKESPENCARYLLQLLRLHLNACGQINDLHARDQLFNLAEETAAGFFGETPTDAPIITPELAGEIITYSRSREIQLSIDKVSYFLPGATSPLPLTTEIDGQLTMDLEHFIPLKYERPGSEKEITLLYNYFFDDDILSQLNVKKKIDDEDYFVLSFIDNAFRNGNALISPTKLFKEINGRDPKGDEIEKLMKRLVKLSTTSIYINDKAVQQAWGNETFHESVFRLAPIAIGNERAIASGRLISSTIKIEGTSVFLQIGASIGQVTTVPKEVLYVKKKDGKAVKRTDRFYRVLHYCMRRIAHMKHGNGETKIVYDTLYRETGETTKRGQDLAYEMLYTVLEHFKKTGWIEDFSDERKGDAGVRIKVKTPKKITKKPTKKKPTKKKA